MVVVRIIQQPLCLRQDPLALGADQLDDSGINHLRSLGFMAENQDGLG